ncbi:MAG: hypothetical protein NUV78_01365 [Candidatus Zambryskibacteria bacterium]|nr:hypothetical protein [Candidatus Zambryskibacteria bacterium]
MDPESPLKQIRTFQGDVADALSGQKESVFSIHQKEEIKKRESGIPTVEEANEKNAASKKRKDFIFLLIGSIFFVSVGVAASWYGYVEFMKRSAPPVLAVPENRFISVSKEVDMNLTNASRETFASAFAEALVGLNPGELVHVVGKVGMGETSSIITAAQFFSLIESRAPGSLVRSFDDLFMIGAIRAQSESGEASPFIIIRLNSFENAFAGMLSWEKDMPQDLLPLFSNSELVKAIDETSVFKDAIVKNKDVRILEVSAPVTDTAATSTASSTEMRIETVLAYSFFDNNMLIITNKIEALQTLIDRLIREKLVR